MPRSLHAFMVWTHRWVGLTLGAILTVICSSGSALYFQPQFWEWAHGDLTPANLSQSIGSIDRWIEQGRAAVPDLGQPIAVWAPHVEHNQSRAGMLIFAGKPPGGLGNMGFVAVLVAPDSGRVLGTVDVDRSPAYAPLFLHRDLWTGGTGRFVSGITALATLLLLVIGLYLWWPASNRIGRKLTGQPWRVTFRRARPLHDWIGIWSLVLLTILVVSGLALVQPSWMEPVINAAAGPEPAEPAGPATAVTSATSATSPTPATSATSATCAGPISFDRAIEKAAALVPSGRFRSLYPSFTSRGTWELVLATDDSDARHLETHVTINQACGIVAIEATPQTRSAHETASLWLSDTHTGTAFGPAGPLIVTLCGLSPLVLFWSGIVMWLRGRRRNAAV